VDQEPFPDAKAWERTVCSHAVGVVPEDGWEGEVDVYGTPLRANHPLGGVALGLPPNINLIDTLSDPI
jgi:hypothetical protein